MSDAILPVYGPAQVVLERGEGVRLFDDKGKEYLDFIGGIAVTSLGHHHPALVNALKEQADKVWHLSNMFRIPGQERLAERYCNECFADKVFFTNSGSEAIELSLKLARRWQWANGHEERIGFISFHGSFHGRTMGAINVGAQEKYREGFGPRMEGFRSLEWGDHEALKEEITKPDVAAVMIEPVQGEGGVREVPHQCLQGLRKLCDENGVLLIYDEVQCGAGRTGKLFHHQWIEGAEPDIMAVAKGIGGGFPLGACLATEDAASGMKPGTHGTTYGGNPLAMAVGNAVLDVVLADGFLEEVQKKGLLLKQKLAGVVDGHPAVFEDLRGKGLMLGLKCRVTNTDLLARFREAGVLAVGAGDNVLRIMPPLTITEAEIEEAVSRIEQAATAMESGLERGAAE